MNRGGWGRNRDIPHAKFIPVRYGDLNNKPCVMYEVLIVILEGTCKPLSDTSLLQINRL